MWTSFDLELIFAVRSQMSKLPRNPHVTVPSPRSSEPLRGAHLLSDAQRMARGRAQIAAGSYVEIDDVDAYFDSLQSPPFHGLN